MPKITRATQQIFGASAPSTQITAFGTAMTDNPVYTTDPAELQTAASLLGWDAAIEADKAPFEEDTNGLCYLITRQLAYLYQQGIAEWDSDTTYYQNSQCSVIQDGILVIKRSLTDNNIGNDPTTDNVNWADYFSQRVIHTIGDPIITLNPVLEDNEIWLEGATVSRTTYSNLFQVYGTTYGAGDGSTTFQLPDFRNRAIWGANSFGYLAAGLPNITGSVGYDNAGVYLNGRSITASNGALSISHITSAYGDTLTAGGSQTRYNKIGINASRSSSIYGNSTTVQPPSIKVRVKTRYQ